MDQKTYPATINASIAAPMAMMTGHMGAREGAAACANSSTPVSVPGSGSPLAST